MDIASINEWLKPKTPTPVKGQDASGKVTDIQAPRKATAEQRDAQADDPERVREAVSSIQEYVQTVRRDINFSLDDSSGRMVVKVTDTSSGEVIRQIPSEEALKLAESLSAARSLLFTAQV